MVSVGVKVTDRVCVPACQHSAGGRRIDKGPGTLAVASSCVLLRAVPYVMFAGVAQVIVGVAWLTKSCTLAGRRGVVGGIAWA